MRDPAIVRASPDPVTSPPPRAERVDAVRALLGEADPASRALAVGIRRVARRQFQRAVEPLVDVAWPAVRRAPFYDKLRIGACDLYASAPYTALFCSANPPAMVRLATAVGGRLPLSLSALARLGGGAVTAFGRFGPQAPQRRIALIAAFIVCVDHALDHGMSDPPARRGERLEAVLAGRSPADSEVLALSRALAVEMGAGLRGEERASFERAMARVREWIRAEVRAMCGEVDPRGLGHRLAGVEGTIDGLLFPVERYAGEETRRWMYDVSLFVQVLDDWFDWEADAKDQRPTPVTEGRWRFDDLSAAWRGSVEGLEALVRASGPRSDRYVELVREAYVGMMRDVMEAMAERPDA